MSGDRQSAARPVLLGVVGGAHGLKGECRVKSFTDDPMDLGAYGPLSDAQGNRYTVRSARLAKSVVVVRFAEVSDRNHAERLNGRELFVDRAELPEPDEADAFYLDDLVGFAVKRVDGTAVGSVIAFHDFGAGDIAEIRLPAGRTIMIPFSQAAVPTVDIEAGKMIVEPGPAGLEEWVPDEGEDGA